MAKVRLSDGRVLNFSGTPTRADIDEAVLQLGETGEPEAPVGLPGAARVERLQAQRTPAVETLKEELQTPFTGGLPQRALKTGVTALKAATVPFERAETAVAAPLQKLQEIPGEVSLAAGERAKEALVPSFLTPLTARKKVTEDVQGQAKGFLEGLGEATISGLKGKTVVEFGDVARRAGFSEPISAAIGLGTSAGLFDAALGRPLVKGARQLEDFIKGTVPIKSATDVTLARTKQLHDGLLNVKKTLGKNVANVMEGLKDKQVNVSTLNGILKNLPPEVLKRSKKKFFGVKRLITDELDPAVNNVWKFRQFLDDLLTTKDFTAKIGSKQKLAIRNARSSVAKLLGETDEAIAPVMKNFSSFSRKFDPILDIITNKRGDVVEKGLRSVFKPGAERAKQKFFIDVADFFPETLNIVRDVVRFNRREAIGKVAKGATRTAATIGLLRGAFKGVGEAASGGAGGGQQGGGGGQ